MVCSLRYTSEFAKEQRGSLTVLTQNNSSLAPVQIPLPKLSACKTKLTRNQNMKLKQDAKSPATHTIGQTLKSQTR